MHVNHAISKSVLSLLKAPVGLSIKKLLFLKSLSLFAKHIYTLSSHQSYRCVNAKEKQHL